MTAQRAVPVIVQVVYGMLGKGAEFFGHFLRMAKSLSVTKKHQLLVYIHKFGNVFAHFARIVGNEQNGYTVFPV